MLQGGPHLSIDASYPILLNRIVHRRGGPIAELLVNERLVIP